MTFERTMEIRLISPQEWKDLAPIFSSEGGRLPDPATSTAAVAYDEHGLAGFWTLQQCWHAGPLWVRPDLRGTGLWRKLHGVFDAIFQRHVGTGYYSFSGEAKVEHMFRELGYKDLGYKVWAKEAS